MSAPMHLTGWRLNAGDELTVMDGTSARLVSVNCGGPAGRTVREGEDCARLIAAAPEMLATLMRLEKWFDTDQEILDALPEAERADNARQLAKIRAAIAKARGAA